MLKERYPFYIGGHAEAPNADLEVKDKFTGEIATRVALADARDVDRAIAMAEAAAPAMAAMPAWKRQAILEHCVVRFQERAGELAQSLCIEAGKPIKDSQGEVTRLIDTFKIAAEEAVRIPGEYTALDRTDRTTGYHAITRRVPVGPCSFISPFNFPLNLAAHKIAPAIAAGCPFVLKPATRTPIGALLIGEILAETDMPAGAFSILPCTRESGQLFTEDERLKLLSFTGSPEVGWALKARAGKKKVVLELGGNAACIVDSDWAIEDAVARIVIGAFYQSGQSCIGVQRIYVEESVYDTFKEKLVEKVRALKMGNPKDPETFIGPMIAESEAARLEEWIAEAVSRGGKVLCGGKRDGAMLQATLLEQVPEDCRLAAQEAFGPVAILAPFKDFDEVLERVNRSRFGLQAGIFTRDIQKAHRAWNLLEVGGVVIGDIPSWRADEMPYGGVKDSGLGREGIRYAIEDMTEIRLMVLRISE